MMMAQHNIALTYRSAIEITNICLHSPIFKSGQMSILERFQIKIAIPSIIMKEATLWLGSTLSICRTRVGTFKLEQIFDILPS